MTNRLSEAEREAQESDFRYWMARRKELEQDILDVEKKIDRARAILDADFRARSALQSDKG